MHHKFEIGPSKQARALTYDWNRVCVTITKVCQLMI